MRRSSGERRPDATHGDYRNEFDDWQPTGQHGAGAGRWTWADWLWQGGVWADTDARSGFLAFATLGTGRVWYETSTLHAEGVEHWCYSYSPDDLAEVAAGRREQWQVQPRARWRMRFPGIADPQPGWADEPDPVVVGCAFDPQHSEVHVVVRRGWSTGGPGEFGHAVHVYRLV